MDSSLWSLFKADAHSILLAHHVMTLGSSLMSAVRFPDSDSETNKGISAEESQYLVERHDHE